MMIDKREYTFFKLFLWYNNLNYNERALRIGTGWIKIVLELYA